MKKIVFAAAAAAGLLMVSCATTVPVCATSNPVGTKVGEATAKYLFGYLPLGNSDMSIATAAKNGKITKISTVDQKTSGGGFITKITTIVTGE